MWSIYWNYKKWVNLYEKDPDNAFKKKDIEGGVEKELQGTQGLINVVRGQFLLSENKCQQRHIGGMLLI